MKCNIDKILQQKEMTRGSLSKLCGVAVTANICEGNDLKLSSALKIAAGLGVGVQDVWPNSYKIETKTEVVEVTKSVLVCDSDEEARESVFSEA